MITKVEIYMVSYRIVSWRGRAFISPGFIWYL